MIKVAVTGEFRRGKDTVGSFLGACLASQPTVYMSFAEALKLELSQMAFYFTDPLHTLKEWHVAMLNRRTVNGMGWQWWGEFRRQYYGANYWIDHDNFRLKYAEAVERGHHVIITDMRHHNEAEWCRDNGFYLIRIEGPCRASGETRDPSHPSEASIRELPVHSTIYNNGTLDDLCANARHLLAHEIVPFFAVKG